MARTILSIPEDYGYAHREHRSKKGRKYSPGKLTFTLKKIRKQKKDDKYLKKELCP